MSELEEQFIHEHCYCPLNQNQTPELPARQEENRRSTLGDGTHAEGLTRVK